MAGMEYPVQLILCVQVCEEGRGLCGEAFDPGIDDTLCPSRVEVVMQDGDATGLDVFGPK